MMQSSVAVSGGARNWEGGAGGGGGGVSKRGKKRDASDSNLTDFERFEKRLKLLSLRNSDQNGNLYTPVSSTTSESIPNGLSHADHMQSPRQEDEMMNVDDTRDRVFIHDLDAELADTESDEERLIFLPDIEKKFSKIPQRVLMGRPDGNQELVLYGVPKSLTVDEGHDSVRKAIIETRRRAQEKAAEEARQADMNRKYDHGDHIEPLEIAHGYSSGYDNELGQEQDADSDAMDVD